MADALKSFYPDILIGIFLVYISVKAYLGKIANETINLVSLVSALMLSQLLNLSMQGYASQLFGLYLSWYVVYLITLVTFYTFFKSVLESLFPYKTKSTKFLTNVLSSAISFIRGLIIITIFFFLIESFLLSFNKSSPWASKFEKISFYKITENMRELFFMQQHNDIGL